MFSTGSDVSRRNSTRSFDEEVPLLRAAASSQHLDADDVLLRTISNDELLLRAQGHKSELPRQFSAFSALSLAFSITNSWIGITATFPYPLSAGGGAGLLYSLVLAGISCFIMTAGLAELASAFPTSGGQYHFAFMVSTRKTRALVAYITGWLSVLAWILSVTASGIYVAQMVTNMLTLYNPDYLPKRIHVWLALVLVLAICAATLCLLPKKIPRIENVLFMCSLFGFAASFIVVLSLSKTKQASSVIFTDFVNQSGWDDATAFMLSTGIAMYSFSGTDSVIHISEEVPKPGRRIPRIMCVTVIMGIFTAVPWVLAFLFSSTDLQGLQSSRVPVYTIFYQTTRSAHLSVFFTSWFLIVYTGATMGCLATAGRQTWAFARDGGIPFSPFFSKINPRQMMPVNATLMCVSVSSIYGLIFLGPTTAFNSFVNSAIALMYTSYVIPQAIVLYRGRSRVLPKRHFNLGKFGKFVNAFSVLWVALHVMLYCFPLYMPPTVDNMNYVAVVLSAIAIVIVSTWYGGKRKTFVGPVIAVKVSDDSDRGTPADYTVLRG